MLILEKISENLQIGNANIVLELIEKSIEEGLPTEDILNDGLIKGMSVVGKKFKDGEIFIPEVLIAARAMTKGIERLEPLLTESGVEPKGKLLIGTVQDDLHDIGKNLVSIMFRGAGFQVVDLGVNITVDRFVEEAKKHLPDVIGLSALLTTTMVNMERIVKALRDNGNKSIIIVGGAPVTEEYAKSINADLYARNAVEGVNKTLRLMAS
ncbi:MAG: cobalamin-binding protein [Candidatus Neomarinimicrobiota bacterium]|nr:MAG: cobalamin-binding protein [Candidatus Neomarinimicrobiota bacterium]